MIFTEFLNYFNLENFKIVLGSIKILDITDILLVSLIVFFILIFLKKIKKLSLILIILFLILFYFFSYWFNLIITFKLVNHFFSIFLFLIFIAFQDEIKRLFLLSFDLKFKKSNFLDQKDIENILESLVYLSTNKIGALLVFEGKEKVDPFIENGIKINADISSSLINFIFNKNSFLHDGAIVIKKGKIVKAKAVLPLSKSYENNKFGTRHLAGIGISENTDALVIIVSEERGKISLVKNGHLQPIDNLDDLRKELNNFAFILNKLLGLKESPFSIILIYFASFLISFMIWFYFNLFSLGYIQRSYPVSLEFINLDKNFLIENIIPKEINATFSGKKKDFEIVKTESFKVKIDLQDYKKEGKHIINLTEKDIIYPSNLKILDLSTKKITLELIQIATISEEKK